jgi:outer membrane protein assembly factor BamB
MRRTIGACLIGIVVLLTLPACNRPPARQKPRNDGPFVIGAPAPPPPASPSSVDEEPVADDDDECHEPDSTPAVGGGVVFFVDADCKLRAVDSRTGREIWQFQPESPIADSPIVTGAFAIISSGPRVIALDVRTGRQQWEFESEGSFVSRPAIDRRLLFFSDSSGGFHALDVATGRENWSRKFDDTLQADITESSIYCQIPEYIVRLDPRTGNERWRYHTGESWVEVEPGPGVVCVAGSDGYVFAIDERTSAVLWQVKSNNDPSALTIENGILCFKAADWLVAVASSNGVEKWRYHEEHWDKDYFLRGVTGGVALIESDGNLYGIDVQTGKKKWQFDGQKFLGSARGRILLDGGPYISADDARTGRQQWKFQLPGEYGALSVPAVSGSAAYFVGGEESLFGLNLETGKPLWKPLSGSTGAATSRSSSQSR